MILGGTVLLLGVAMIVLPGPAFIVIPAGLAILAIEFAWARRWLRSARAILPKRSPEPVISEKDNGAAKKQSGLIFPAK